MEAKRYFDSLHTLNMPIINDIKIIRKEFAKQTSKAHCSLQGRRGEMGRGFGEDKHPLSLGVYPENIVR